MRSRSEEASATQIYMEQLRNIPVLSRPEEYLYAERAKRGDEAAKEKILVSNLKFVVKVAMKYRKFGVPLIDLIGEGNVGLIKALEKFDTGRGVRFISYAKWWIRHYILKAILEQSTGSAGRHAGAEDSHEHQEEREYDRSLFSPVSIDRVPVDEDGEKSYVDLIAGDMYESPEDSLIQTQLKESIQTVLRTLNERETDIITRHYGLKGNSPLTLREIGRSYNLSKERIRQIKQHALEKLNTPMVRKKIADFIR